MNKLNVSYGITLNCEVVPAKGNLIFKLFTPISVTTYTNGFCPTSENYWKEEQVVKATFWPIRAKQSWVRDSSLPQTELCYYMHCLVLG